MNKIAGVSIMITLEQEIIEKFRQLTPESQERVLSSLQEETAIQQLSLTAWIAQAETIRLAWNSTEYTPSANELVNEAREERDADILRGLGFRDSTGDSSD
jgi:hypothetical protein